MLIKYSLYKRLQLGLAGITSCISVFLITNQTLAQQSNITPDNMGAESSRLNRNVIINGINADTIDGGARRDINLFHSFSEFNINNGQAVYFVNPDGVENILTRVTGGNASNIFGTLGVDGAANLFLINPGGIVFGENASLDLQGSFVGTTASGLQFGEQGNFSATNPEIPGSLTVNPSALFFNQVEASGGIINKSQAFAGINPDGNFTTGLRVPNGKSLLLVGGDINFDGGRLRAYEGNIELASLNAAGRVGLNILGNTFSLNVPKDIERGDISLTNQSLISVFGTGGGNLTINARNLEISNSFIFAGIGENSENPNAQAGDVNLNATGSIEVKDNVLIDNSVNSQGNAGNININGNSLSLSEGFAISTDTFGIGNAGNINLNARQSISLESGAVSSSNSAGAIGNAGNIQLTTGTLSVTDRAFISSGTFGKGNAGNININARNATFENNSIVSSTVSSDAMGKGGDILIATGTLWVNNGAAILSGTDGQGDAGNITIDASNKVTFDNSGIAGSQSGFNAVGNGGDIRIKTGELLLKNYGSLQTFSDKGGNAGNIFLDVQNTITFDGVGSNGLGSGASTFANNSNAGNIEVRTGSLFLTNGGRMAASLIGQENGDNITNAGNIIINARDTVKIDGASSALRTELLSGKGKGGDINIATGLFSVTNGSEISSATSGKGNAGKIQVDANNSISLANSGSILSNVNPGGEGKGGSININTQTLKLIDGSQITSSVFGKGNGGEININASESVNLSGIGSTGFASGIITETETGASGDAGNITVTTGNFALKDDAIVNARTLNNGNAGNITFNTNTFEAINGGQVNTTTFNSGKAGNINLNIKDAITLSGTGQFFRSGLFASTSPESTGKGGSIFIDPRLVVIEKGAAVSVGSRGTGDAGDISLQAGTLQLNNGFIEAQTASTQGGNIDLQISELLLLRNESQITTTAGTAQAGGNGGNININSKFIVAPQNENSDITANAFSGNGGKVNINSSGIFGIERQDSLTVKSDITASSELGISGETNINAADTSSIQNSFTELSPNIDTDAIIANSCISRSNQRQENSFKITGSGALPSNRPGNVLVSNYTTGEVRNIDSKNQVWKKGDRIIEPQGLYRLKNGELLLSRECSN